MNSAKNILLVSCGLFFSSICHSNVQTPLPAAKYTAQFDEINISAGLDIISTSPVVSGEILEFIKSRFGSIAEVNSSSPDALVYLCDIDSMNTCVQEQTALIPFPQAPSLTGMEDEYLVQPLRYVVDGTLAGVVVAARSVSGFNYAVDWIEDSYDVAQQTVDAVFLHDYPSMQERSIFAPDSDLEFENWKNRINAAARLRIKEMALSLAKDKKIIVSSPMLDSYDSNLVNPDSPFLVDSNLLTNIISYANKRGVSMVPTIFHLSSLELYKYYPEWAMPNGRAMDWRKQEPADFLRAMLSTAMSIEGIKTISVWADEGGVVDRQSDFLQALESAVNEIRNTLNAPIRLRFMVTPVVSVAIRTGRIDNLMQLLPDDTIIDFYAGVEYLGEAGTYHLNSPSLWDDIVFHIRAEEPSIPLTGVGFVNRSRFNEVNFPVTQYIDKFLTEIASHDGQGAYMYLSASYQGIVTKPAAIYVAHRFWRGLDLNSSDLLSTLPDTGWLNSVPVVAAEWESMMTTALMAHSQRLKVRLDKSPTETSIQLDSFLSEVSTGANLLAVNAIKSKIQAVETLLLSSDLSTASAVSRQNLELSILMVKLIVNLRELAEFVHANPVEQYMDLIVHEELSQLTGNYLDICDKANAYSGLWEQARHLPMCTYIPLIQQIRESYNLPAQFITSDLLSSVYGVSSELPDLESYRSFMDLFTNLLERENHSIESLQLPQSNQSSYGYGRFDREHSIQFNYTFGNGKSANLLSFELFDIDAKSELSIYINNQQLINLGDNYLTANQSWGAEHTVTLDESILREDKPNVVEFSNNYGHIYPSRNFVWGVRNVSIEEGEINPYQNPLGYAYFDRTHPEVVQFQQSGAFCEVSFYLFDVDTTREVKLNWNNQPIPVVLPATANQSWGEKIVVNLCEYAAPRSGSNVVEFVNSYSSRSGRPHVWGISGISASQ